MKHQFGYGKLGMKSAHRKAVLRNLATSFFLHENIKTTEAKAKELRRVVDRLITLGKHGDLHSRRKVASYVFDKIATKKIFDELPERLKEHQGGYTRILKMGKRKGDCADIVSIQIVDYKPNTEPKKKAPKKKDIAAPQQGMPPM